MKLKIYSFIALMITAPVIWASEPPHDEAETNSEISYKFTGGRFGDNIVYPLLIEQIAPVTDRSKGIRIRENWPELTNPEILHRITICQKISQLLAPPLS
jgi:hypothetical protein